MHYAGRGMTVKVIRASNNATNPRRRDWVQTDDMMTLLHWDPNWQGIKILNPAKPVKVYPGDRIVTTCHYDSTGRDRPIRNGEGFLDEMCIPFVTYYPQINIKWCASLGDEGTSGLGALCNAGVGENPRLPFAPSNGMGGIRDLPFEELPQEPNNCPWQDEDDDEDAGKCGPNNEYSNIVECTLKECPRLNIEDCVKCVGCLNQRNNLRVG